MFFQCIIVAVVHNSTAVAVAGAGAVAAAVLIVPVVAVVVAFTVSHTVDRSAIFKDSCPVAGCMVPLSIGCEDIHALHE